MADMVNHPPHYQSSNGLEVIDVIEAFTEDLKGMEAVYTANIIKYICRWKKKNGIEDLKKARWYLSNLIDLIGTDISKEPFERPNIKDNDGNIYIYDSKHLEWRNIPVKDMEVTYED